MPTLGMILDSAQTTTETLLVTKPNPYWTAAGGALVLWNAAHWKKPERHVSRMASRHPLVTSCVLGAYAYHFLHEWKPKRLIRHKVQ